MKVIEYDMIFNKLVTRNNKKVRTSQPSQFQDQDEDDEYAYIDVLEILKHMEDILVREERNEDEMPTPPHATHPPTSTKRNL